MFGTYHFFCILFIFSSSNIFGQSDSLKWSKEFSGGISYYLKGYSNDSTQKEIFPNLNLSYSLTRELNEGFGLRNTAGVFGSGWTEDRYEIKNYLNSQEFIIIGERYTKRKSEYYFISTGISWRKVMKRMNLSLHFSPLLNLFSRSKYLRIDDLINSSSLDIWSNSTDWNYYLKLGFIGGFQIGLNLKNNFELRLTSQMIKISDNLKTKEHQWFFCSQIGLVKNFRLTFKSLSDISKEKNFWYVEAFGSSLLYSLNYERKLNKQQFFSLNARVGLAYLFGFHFQSGLSFILGRNTPKFELALTNLIWVENYNAPTNFFCPSIGFRRETPKNWVMKFQIVPWFEYDSNSFEILNVVPGFSLGKKF